MTLTKAALVLTHDEIQAVVKSSREMVVWQEANAISQAAAAKAAYAVLDELGRQMSLLFSSNLAWTHVVRLGDELKNKLEAAGLLRPGKSG